MNTLIHKVSRIKKALEQLLNDDLDMMVILLLGPKLCTHSRIVLGIHLSLNVKSWLPALSSNQNSGYSSLL